MIDRRHLLSIAAASALMPVAVKAGEGPSAETRLSELGPENEALLKRVGLWDVTETVWASPGAAPVVTTGLVAERRMIGLMLQEVLRQGQDVSDAAIRRMDYLTYNRVVGRWDYVSMDTRVPVGIMPATSFDRDQDAGIVLSFQSGALAGAGPEVAGQMYRMEQAITIQSQDRDSKDQTFIMADGTGTKWLAHRYGYVRRS